MLSRELASSLGVPVAPGTQVSSVVDVHQFAKQLAPHPFPIVIKALDGGGGRGIRLVNATEAVDNAFQRCLGESPSKQVFVERAFVGPGWKHVEVQVVGDGDGNVAHLWERECSIQRRCVSHLLHVFWSLELVWPGFKRSLRWDTSSNGGDTSPNLSPDGSIYSSTDNHRAFIPCCSEDGPEAALPWPWHVRVSRQL